MTFFEKLTKWISSPETPFRKIVFPFFVKDQEGVFERKWQRIAIKEKKRASQIFKPKIVKLFVVL